MLTFWPTSFMNLFDTAFIIALGNFFYVTFNTSLQQLKSRLFYFSARLFDLLSFLFFVVARNEEIAYDVCICVCEFWMPPVIISSIFLFEPVFFLHHFVLLRYYYSILIFKKKKRNKNNRVACLCVHLTWSNSIDSRLWIFKNLNMISFFFLLLSFALYKCASMIGVNPKYVHISTGIEP